MAKSIKHIKSTFANELQADTTGVTACSWQPIWNNFTNFMNDRWTPVISMARIYFLFYLREHTISHWLERGISIYTNNNSINRDNNKSSSSLYLDTCYGYLMNIPIYYQSRKQLRLFGHGRGTDGWIRPLKTKPKYQIIFTPMGLRLCWCYFGASCQNSTSISLADLSVG